MSLSSHLLGQCPSGFVDPTQRTPGVPRRALLHQTVHLLEQGRRSRLHRLATGSRRTPTLLRCEMATGSNLPHPLDDGGRGKPRGVLNLPNPPHPSWRAMAPASQRRCASLRSEKTRSQGGENLSLIMNRIAHWNIKIYLFPIPKH